MVVQAEQDRVKHLLSEALPLLCKSGLKYSSEFCIEALIGITLDKNEVFLVSVKETIKSEPSSDDESMGGDRRTVDVSIGRAHTGEDPRGRTENLSTTTTRRKRRSPERLLNDSENCNTYEGEPPIKREKSTSVDSSFSPICVKQEPLVVDPTAMASGMENYSLGGTYHAIDATIDSSVAPGDVSSCTLPEPSMSIFRNVADSVALGADEDGGIPGTLHSPYEQRLISENGPVFPDNGISPSSNNLSPTAPPAWIYQELVSGSMKTIASKMEAQNVVVDNSVSDKEAMNDITECTMQKTDQVRMRSVSAKVNDLTTDAEYDVEFVGINPGISKVSVTEAATPTIMSISPNDTDPSSDNLALPNSSFDPLSMNNSSANTTIANKRSTDSLMVQLAGDQWKCALCNQLFTRAHTVRMHINVVHLKERPYQCSNCPAKFGKKYNKTMHERICRQKTGKDAYDSWLQRKKD